MFKDVDDLDRSNPTETLQKDAFLVHVVRKFAHLIGMRAGRGFDVMWLVDQRESPSNRLVIARQADKGFQEANNALPMLWAIFTQAGAAVYPGKFHGNLNLAHASKAVWGNLYWAMCRRPCEGILRLPFQTISPESACSCSNIYIILIPE